MRFGTIDLRDLRGIGTVEGIERTVMVLRQLMQVSPRAQLSSSQLASSPVHLLREAGKRPGWQKQGCSPQAPHRIAQAAEVPKAFATVLDCRAMMTDQGDNFQILNFMVGMTSITRF